jgi:DNA-binding Xre family transcriptional regulator
MVGVPFTQEETMNPNTKLKVVLMEKNLSQRDLAFGAEISEDRISQAIRYGKTTPEMRKKICKFLGVAESEIFPIDARTQGSSE